MWIIPLVKWSVHMLVATWYRTTYQKSIPDVVSEAVQQGRMVSTAMGKEGQ